MNSSKPSILKRSTSLEKKVSYSDNLDRNETSDNDSQNSGEYETNEIEKSDEKTA